MSDFRNYQTRSVPAGTRADAGIDEGLRAYMLKVYNLMGLGLLIDRIDSIFGVDVNINSPCDSSLQTTCLFYIPSTFHQNKPVA